MLDVAIVGGGPGGAAAANSVLKAAPHARVKVFERARQLRRVGFTLVLAENGLNALHAIDPTLGDRFAELLLPGGPMVRHDHKGKELSRAQLLASGETEARVGFVPWYQVQQTLLDALPAGTLELGCDLLSVDASPDAVTLSFRDRPPVQARVAVGCDGNQSVVRQAVVGDGPPIFSNRAIWRGQAVKPTTWPYEDNLSTWFLSGAGEAMHFVRLRDGRLAWTVAINWPQEALGKLASGRYVEAAATPAADCSKLEQCLACAGTDWPAIALAVIRSTDPSTITEHGIFYREASTCQMWGRGRLTLLGDAAHLSSPLLAQGLNQALEDALELGRAIGEHGPAEAALREYEGARLPRNQRVHTASIALMKAARRGERVREGEWHAANTWCMMHQPKPLVAAAPEQALGASCTSPSRWWPPPPELARGA